MNVLTASLAKGSVLVAIAPGFAPVMGYLNGKQAIRLRDGRVITTETPNVAIHHPYTPYAVELAPYEADRIGAFEPLLDYQFSERDERSLSDRYEAFLD